MLKRWLLYYVQRSIIIFVIHIDNSSNDDEEGINKEEDKERIKKSMIIL